MLQLLGKQTGRKPTEASVLQGTRGASRELTLPKSVSCTRGPGCRGLADRQAQPGEHRAAAAKMILTAKAYEGTWLSRLLLQALLSFTCAMT